MKKNINLEKIFLSESADILASLENDFLALEKDTANEEIRKAILRGVHTLKGSSGVVDGSYIPGYVHNFETRLKSIFDKADISSDEFNFLFKNIDYIQGVITKTIANKEELDETEYKKMMDDVTNFGVESKDDDGLKNSNQALVFLKMNRQKGKNQIEIITIELQCFLMKSARKIHGFLKI